MTELFLTLLEVSLSGSLLIGLVLLLRLVFRCAPKALVCMLWAMVILRLLLPVRLESPLSIRPQPSFDVRQEAVALFESEKVVYTEITESGDQQSAENTKNSAINPMTVVSGAWMAGACIIGLYALVSYIRLKMRVGGSVRIEKGIYVCPGLDTAFLLGYLQPRIYLPDRMDQAEAAFVTAHEQAHLRRRDHWLKLAGFACVALHWYNPLAWLMFALLSMDIEEACDEAVIRNMGTDERKAYSTALLSCGIRRKKRMNCPVAFAEGDIKVRIMRILNYRKPPVWICAVLIIAIVLTAVFVLPDALGPEHPEYYDELINMLGLPMERVYQELGISKEDVEGLDDRSGLYKTKLKAEYAGVSFDLWLIAVYGEDTLGGFQYWNVYEQNKEQAVKDAVVIANKLGDEFGTSGKPNTETYIGELKTATEESVSKLFENYRRKHVGISELWGQWDMTDSDEGRIKEYLSELQNSEVWQASYGDKGFVPHYAMTFTAWNDDEVDEAIVAITYKTHIGDGNSYS